jgi:3-oxoadipate enol-lactonase
VAQIAPQPPVPPQDYPPARTVVVPDRGEFFLRDSGGPGPAVFLLHGWVGSADLNFGAMYPDLVDAGYRVLAIDHRGHGRGLRPLEPFRLLDCAADAAAVMREVGVAPAIVYGYSMGGAIAQLVARDHPDVVAALVLSGTAQHWREDELKRAWRAMPLVGLSLAPGSGWRVALKRAGFRAGPTMSWLHSEMTRHSARAIAEAGKELGRFDSRPWLGPFPFPTAVLVTTEDDAVPAAKQYELATATAAEIFEAPVRHLDVGAIAREAPTRIYNEALLETLNRMRAAAASGSLSRHES